MFKILFWKENQPGWKDNFYAKYYFFYFFLQTKLGSNVVGVWNEPAYEKTELKHWW